VSFKGFFSIADQFLMGLRSRKPSEIPNSLSTFPEDGRVSSSPTKEELKIGCRSRCDTISVSRGAQMFYWEDLR